MKTFRNNLKRGVTACSVAAALLLAAVPAEAAKLAARNRIEGASALPGAPRVELSTDPGTVVISLRETIGEMESPDQPWMKVYADGRVERHLPAYMKNAGTWTGRIGPAELEALTQSVAGAGVVEFDARQARKAKSLVQRESGTLSYVSDTSLIEIQVRFAEYQRPGSLTVQRNVEKVAAWDGLRNDARRYPQIESLQGLLRAFGELGNLADRIVASGTLKGVDR